MEYMNDEMNTIRQLIDQGQIHFKEVSDVKFHIGDKHNTHEHFDKDAHSHDIPNPTVYCS